MIPLKHDVLRVLCLLVCLSCSMMGAKARDSLTSGETSPPGSGTLLLRYTDGLLSVSAKDIYVSKLLDELSAQSGIAVVGQVASDQRLSVEFYELTLHQALRRIAGRHNFILLSAQHFSPQGPASLTPSGTLWIFPRSDEQGTDQHQGIESQSVNVTTGSIWLQSKLSDTDPDERADAVAELQENNNQQTVRQLAVLMVDENADVRESVVAALAAIGDNSAIAVLAGALGDADPRVREQAVDALGEIGGTISRGLLEQALWDEEIFVRDAAAEMLAELRRLD